MSLLGQVIKLESHKFPVKQLKGKYCITPFILVSITDTGQVYLCGCSWWMTQPVGNILTSTLDEILSSDIAKNIRQSIIDGSYVYCNEKVCGVMSNNGLNTVDTLPTNVARLITDSSKYDLPYHIHLSLDQTCNLSCPSCRTSVIKVPAEEKQQQRQLGQTVLRNLLSTPTNQKIVIEISAGGELFSSEMLMELLSGIDVTLFPNLEIHIGTNATLITKRWNRIKNVEKHIKKITVSVDAGSKEVYEQVRRGGKWADLCSGMEFLKNKKQELNFELNGRLIFQRTNYKDSEKFYDLCQQWNCNLAEYSRVYSWNTWTPEEFLQHDVYNPDHQEYTQAFEIIERVKKLPNTWFNGF
jgi:molybdenum cofactor biosynthesis enzyme MoaA